MDTDILYQQLFYSHKQLEVDLKLVFNCIRFLKDNHKYDRSLDDLYKMIGILAERLYVDGDEAFNILESYMQMYIIRAYMSILNKDKVTIRDIITLYNINLFTYLIIIPQILDNFKTFSKKKLKLFKNT